MRSLCVVIGLVGACVALLIVFSMTAACSRGKPLSLVFVSLDTVRRDHLPTFGYSRDTAPAIDRLATVSVVFDNAFAQDTNTNPSHTSMFTGVYPHVHGSQDNIRLLRHEQVTLAQILNEAGFRTSAFVSGLNLHRNLCGLDRGFDLYEDRIPDLRRDGRETLTLASSWLRRSPASQPFFLFLHLFDAHGPYRPPDEYKTLFTSDDPGPVLASIPGYQRATDENGSARANLNWFRDRYDAMIRYEDDLVAELLEELDLQSTVVVVVSDHGETLGERFWALDHGGQVFEEQTRIPMIIYAPGFAPVRVESIVETVDLLPTLLEILGVAVPPSRFVQGRSLVPLMKGGTAPTPRHAFSSARAVSARHSDRGYTLDGSRRIRSVRSADWKLIQYPGASEDSLELYDLRSDPLETNDVADRAPDVRDELLEVLREWSVGDVGDQGPSPYFDADLYERLRALGYVAD